MLNRILLLCFLFLNNSSYGQWKSFYPDNKLKNQSNKNQGKGSNETIKYNNIFFSALKQKSLDNKEASLALFEKCIEKNPTIYEAYYQASTIYKTLKKPIIAKEYSLKAVDSNKKNIWYLRNHAEILFINQEYNESAKQYVEIIKLQPDNEFNYYKLADTYIYNQQYLRAIKVYDDLESLKGTDKMLSMQKHKLYLQVKDIKKATKTLELLSDKYPKDIEVLHILAEAYILNNQNEKAFSIFQQISEKDPENGRIHLTLANLYRDNGDLENSFQELKKAFINEKVLLETKIAILSSYIGIISVNDTIRKQAFELGSILLNKHQDEAIAYAIYGDLYYADGNKKKAKTNYKKSISISQSIQAVWTQLLFLEVEENNYDSLLIFSNKAISYFPSDPLYYYFHAISNIYFKKYDTALNSLELGVEYVFDNEMLYAEFQSSLADTYHALKIHDKSDSIFDQLLLNNSNNVIVLNNYSYYLSLRKKDLNRAKKMSKKCNDLEPNNGTYQDTYGWVLYCLGDFENAKIWIERALSNGSQTSAVVVEHYGDILFNLGLKKEAVSEWIKAKNLGDGSKFLEEKIKNEDLFE